MIDRVRNLTRSPAPYMLSMFDYGWIEEVDKGSRVWEMQEGKTTHAGCASKNRKVDVVITLPTGNDKLRDTSDDSHAFDHWNSLPPDILGNYRL